MTWTPPSQGYSAQPPKPQGPARLSWRLGHSAWVLLPILSCGCLSGLGFLYVGIRAKRLNWSIAGVVYSVLGTSAGIWGSSQPKESLASDLAFGFLLVVWMSSVVHALVINSEWLRWRAGYQPWYAQQPAAPWAGAPAPAPVPPQVQGLVPPPSDYYGAQPPAYGAPPPHVPPAQTNYSEADAVWQPPSKAGTGAVPPGPFDADSTAVPPGPFGGHNAAAPPGPSHNAAVPPGPFGGHNAAGAPGPFGGHDPAGAPGPFGGHNAAGASGPLDVNSASAEQFAMLPGVGLERAAQAVSARDSQGGFASLAEFAAAASLAPHEFVAVRDRLTCVPPRSAAPQHDHDQPFGRIVDV